MIKDTLTTGGKWPPEKERLDRYQQNELLFEGDMDNVKDVFPDWENRVVYNNTDLERAMTYLVVNFPGAVTKLGADLLYGEGFDIIFRDQKIQERAKIFTKGIHQIAYETGGLAASYHGDGLFLPTYDKVLKRVVIRSQPANYWFVVTHPDDAKQVLKHIIAFELVNGEKKYLRKITHEIGRITNEAYILEGTEIGAAVSLATVYEGLLEPDQIPLESVDTKINDFLIVHCPNFTMNKSLFGIDDYRDLYPLFREINDILSRNSWVLFKHSNPSMYGDSSNLNWNEEKLQWEFPAGGDKFYPVSAGGTIPGYITWDGKLTEAFQQIDKLVEFMFYISETSPAAFGLDKSGFAESGSALKRRLLRTLAKVNRKKIYANAAMLQLLTLCQMLDVTWGGGNYEIEEPTIKWKDGIPDDPAELTDLLQKRLGASGGVQTIETWEAIQEESGKSADEAKRTAAAIQAEKAADLEALGLGRTDMFSASTDEDSSTY